jgi:hypothetical protein
MQLHTDAAALLDTLAEGFALALRRGDATCVIAPSDLRDGLALRLRARGWEVDGAAPHARHLAVDSAAALARCMRDGLPDAGVLAEIAGELETFRRTVTDPGTSRLIIAGNIGASLSAEGNTAATIALEQRWNAVTQGLPFVTVCAYPTTGFTDAEPDFYARMCAEHCTVSHAGRG